ncbi:hypothetical protein PVK06_011834 [Gossypium arboreum]|uniref:Uncharacterized protein n=1 Tax=Gossypium arboreum TaxID=29729 RepID=A0ABR0Q9W0_GOSAR|nr:hypothetical protein PVK06_011834 [Gossypium arboreum]
MELNEECSAILQNKLPTKLKDPGSFTIPCLIGSLNVDKALADLGASINLMPYKIFKQLGLGEPKPTRMSIQLADRSVKYPRGIIEDVLVKLDKFIFPVDFIVLDMDKDVEVPLILGRPFLATAKAVIDVGDGKLVLRVGDEEIIFKIYDAMSFLGNRMTHVILLTLLIMLLKIFFRKSYIRTCWNCVLPKEKRGMIILR